jgi:hypothetical protein
MGFEIPGLRFLSFWSARGGKEASKSDGPLWFSIVQDLSLSLPMTDYKCCVTLSIGDSFKELVEVRAVAFARVLLGTLNTR